MINRRSLITGLIRFVAAPAIVRVESLMPVKTYKKPTQAEIEAVLEAMMEPWMKNLTKAYVDAIIYGQGTILSFGNETFRVEPMKTNFNGFGLAGLLNDHS